MFRDNDGQDSVPKGSNCKRFERVPDVNSNAMAAAKLLTVEFEVFGIVQGVFFRKYTKRMADKLNLVGWVRNTEKSTVVGQLQGPENMINTIFVPMYGYSKKPQSSICDEKKIAYRLETMAEDGRKS